MKAVLTPSAPTGQGKRARTRQLLIEAAATLIRENGYAKLSMEGVAVRAGVSRGSIYGNFEDRNDLIVAVAATRIPRIAPKPIPGATLPEQMRAMGKAVARAARDNRKNAIHWNAYMMHVLGDEALRRRAAAQGRKMRQRLMLEWAKAIPSESLPMPLEMFVKVMGALTTSLIMAHAMAPNEFGEDVIIAACEALAGAAR